MSLKSQSNLRTNSLQYLENEPLNVLKLIVDRILWIEMIEISSFNIFWQKYIEKNFYNCIAIPWKWVAPSMSLKPHSNTLNPQGRRQNHQERHQSCPKTGGKTTRKDIRVIPRQEAKPPGKTSELSFLGHIWRNCLLSWENSDRCGIFWLGWLMDVGRYEGVAPSMWAFPAWFWRMSGSCAIYVPKNDIFFQLHWFPPIFFLNIKLPFWDIDGATSVILPAKVETL